MKYHICFLFFSEFYSVFFNYFTHKKILSSGTDFYITCNTRYGYQDPKLTIHFYGTVRYRTVVILARNDSLTVCFHAKVLIHTDQRMLLLLLLPFTKIRTLVRYIVRFQTMLELILAVPYRMNVRQNIENLFRSIFGST